ncbi:MAG TPA: phosphatase PAP2 family protein [Candidatus Methylacidiphilales bacterium]|jgi:hypothetical protein|nr:phosphatase PAP2 family protein [Candidatus Methylacidiphilales bacterium]
MKKLSYLLVAFLFALTLTVRGDASMEAVTQAAAYSYFDPATVDFKALLPDPPADGSAATKREIDLILQKQAARTPEEVARIKREVNLNVYLFDTVLGSWFTEKNLPATAALFRKVDDNVRPVVDSAKKFWHRPRPFLQDKRVRPPIDPPKNGSYPSGHSTVGYLDASILAQIEPDLKDKLLARGREIGDDRVIGGVHFPSDVKAGHILATALFAKLMASPAFQADLAKAKAEIAAGQFQHR